MSVTEPTTPTESTDLDRLPTFGLSYLFDDEEGPTEVTLFPSADEGDVLSEWITVDVDAAVPLEDVR